MKPKVSNILLVGIVLTSLARVAVASDPDDTSRHLFLAVVIDSSPASVQTWRLLKASACQAIDSLYVNDRVEVLRARAGEPALHSDSLIQSPTTSSRQNLRQCIRDIRQVFFLSRADVAKAVAVAFEHIGKHSGEYRCAVLVVSTGNLADDQVRQIRRLAEAYRFRNWPLAFLVQQSANRNLFLAASQGDLDVMFIEKANLAQWLEKARGGGSTKKTENAHDPQRLSPLQKSPPVEPELPSAPTPPRLPPAQLTPEPEAKPLPTP